MTKETPPKGKQSDAVNMLKSAQSAEQPSDIDLTNMPPVDVAGMIARSIAHQEYSTAKDMAETAATETKIKRIEAEKKLAKLESDDARPAMPGFGLQSPGGFGGLSAKTAMLKTILDNLPEDKRADWIEKNKDFIMSPDASTSGLLGQFVHTQTKQAPQNNELSTAALIGTVGEESRQNQLLFLKMFEMLKNNTQPAPQPQTAPGMDVMSFMKNMMDTQNQMMQNMSTMFTSSISKLTDQMKDERQQTQAALLASQKESLELQKQMQEEQLNSRMEMMNKELDALKSTAGRLPPNVLTMDAVPGMLETLRRAGMDVQTKSAQDTLSEKQYELDKMKLEHDMQMQTLQMQNEAARQNANAAKLNALVGLAQKGLEATRIDKAIKSGGSPSAQRATGAVVSGMGGI